MKKLHEKKISELAGRFWSAIDVPVDAVLVKILKEWAVAVVRAKRMLRAGLIDGGDLGQYGEDVDNFLIDRFEITEKELE